MHSVENHGDYGNMQSMSTSIFSKIISRELSAHFIYEDDVCVAIMDKFPAVKGQSIVIPKEEIDYAFDLDDNTYQHLFSVAKKIGRASDKAFDAMRTCLVIEGFEVPHVHLKIFPMQNTDKALGEIMLKVEEASDDDLAQNANLIRQYLL
ncbi:hypothetical protein CL653_00520 [bacterium]|nr:hypothetical protein [bacterium]